MLKIFWGNKLLAFHWRITSKSNQTEAKSTLIVRMKPRNLFDEHTKEKGQNKTRISISCESLRKRGFFGFFDPR